MEQLGERNYALITRGVKCEGSYDPDKIFYMFEEDLFTDEYEEIEAFLRWCHEKKKYFGHGNYEERFAEFKKSQG